MLFVLDLVSRICNVVLVRRTFSSGKPRGVGILEWGGNGEGMTLTSGVQAAAGDESIVDSLEGTVVWEYDSMACPRPLSGCTEG
jgi:hypothetical protein